MHKFIYGGALILALGLAVISCGKSTSKNNFYQKEAVKSPEKNTWASDEDLIKAIKGETDAYVAILSLEDYLYDNAKLSDAVVAALIAEQRVPDYVVETALVLSAPLSSNNMSALGIKRPNMATTAIVKANNIPSSVGYAIFNTSPRQVIFGNNITKTVKPGSEDCNCGDGVVKVGSNHMQVTLTSTVTPVDPADPNQAKPCNSENTTWTCGDLVRATLNGTDGTTASYSITCTQSTAKCFKNPRDARR